MSSTSSSVQEKFKYAIVQGREQGARALVVEGGEDPNALNEHGETWVYYFTLAGNERGIRILIDLKADVRTPTTKGHTPLAEAIRQGNAEVARALVEGGADPNVLLYSRALAGDERGIGILVASGASVNAFNNSNQAAIRIAVQQMQQPTARLLLKIGVGLFPNMIQDQPFLTALNALLGFGIQDYTQVEILYFSPTTGQLITKVAELKALTFEEREPLIDYINSQDSLVEGVREIIDSTSVERRGKKWYAEYLDEHPPLSREQLLSSLASDSSGALQFSVVPALVKTSDPSSSNRITRT